MSNSQVSAETGVGLPGLLLVLFIGLKLGKVISWSWWWVLSPFWIPFVLVMVILIFVVIGTALFGKD